MVYNHLTTNTNDTRTSKHGEEEYLRWSRTIWLYLKSKSHFATVILGICTVNERNVSGYGAARCWELGSGLGVNFWYILEGQACEPQDQCFWACELLSLQDGLFFFTQSTWIAVHEVIVQALTWVTEVLAQQPSQFNCGFATHSFPFLTTMSDEGELSEHEKQEIFQSLLSGSEYVVFSFQC
jgi:uncharacterized membrane protein